jgi:hypothetical protein
MKRLYAVAGALALAPMLGACANMDSAEKTVFQIRAAYDAGPLVLATNYESLPRCGAVEPKICSDPGVVEELRKADLSALASLDAAESFVGNHPEMDASDAIEAANLAVSVFAQILANYGIDKE